MLAVEAAHTIERADHVSRLRTHAETDSLTGLFNRRSWNAIALHAFTAARDSGEPLAVALIDLDRFKQFNDEQGHQAGDQLLRAAATAWRSELRHHDTLARYGGEEFIVLLPNCHANQAAHVLDRLRQATPSPQTCSVGIADTTQATTLTDLIEIADRALYHAKAQGRNTVVVSQQLLAA
jgi:diguanylate cyclase (GGDEF)-like protein